MIGRLLQLRTSAQTSTPLPSGSTRSSTIASGGRTDTASSASDFVSAVATS